MSGGSESDAATVVKMITRSAAADGEDAPTDIQWITATRADIAGLLDFGMPADEGSRTAVLVIARGKFTDNAASRPPGTDPPSGAVLELVLDPNTWRVTDYGLVQRMPDLGSVGTTIFRP